MLGGVVTCRVDVGTNGRTDCGRMLATPGNIIKIIIIHNYYKSDDSRPLVDPKPNAKQSHVHVLIQVWQIQKQTRYIESKEM